MMRISRIVGASLVGGLIGLIAAVGLSTVAHAKRLQHEAVYTEQWCADHGGSEASADVTTPDGKRADCVTADHAIEFDFADKFYEGVGQAVYYGIALDRQPGLVLIIEDDGDCKNWSILKGQVVPALRILESGDGLGLTLTIWQTGPVVCPHP